MLIAKNRLPKQIIGNGQEVEKLVVSGTTWFDATTTFPVEGSLPKLKYKRGTSSGDRVTQGFVSLKSQVSVADLLYKDSDGYCYVIDTETNTIKRFKNTLAFKWSTSYTGSIVFDANTAGITINREPIKLYGTTDLRVKALCCNYWPILKGDVASTVSIVQNAPVDLGVVLDTSSRDTVTEDEGIQYNILLRNQGVKDYALKAKIGRLYIECMRLIDDTATITLESDGSWLDTREQVFIDGTQS